MRDPATSSEIARWLRICRASVSRQAVLLVCALLVLLAFVPIGILCVPREVREQRAFEFAFELLRTTPPLDELIKQLPPERLASARARGLAMTARVLNLALVGSVGLLFAGVAGFAGLARILRPRFARVVVTRRAAVSPLIPSWPVFAGFGVFGVLAHLPYALSSLRFDEDGASLQATRGVWSWANNLGGWQSHVGALLSIRLSTAVFGMNELSVRAPAVLASSWGVALICAHLWSRYSRWAAVLTAVIIAIVPLWAEQTSLARGYGLVFFGASLLTVGLMRLYDEADQPSHETMRCIALGVCVGALSHFFFLFFVTGVCVLIATSSRLHADLRSAVVWWIGLAFLPAAISHAFGAPAVLTQMQDVPNPGVSVVWARFVAELGFRQPGVLGQVLTVLALGVLLTAALSVPRPARVPLWIVMCVSILVPMLAQPVYLYPRFYLQVLAPLAPAVAWLVSVRWLRERSAWNACLLVLLLAGGLVAGHPWRIVPSVPLRLAAQMARAQQQQYGARFAVDTFLSTGIRFYNGTAGRIVNTQHPAPPDVQRILLALPRDPQAQVPADFHVSERYAGTEHDLVVLERNAQGS